MTRIRQHLRQQLLVAMGDTESPGIKRARISDLQDEIVQSNRKFKLQQMSVPAPIVLSSKNGSHLDGGKAEVEAAFGKANTRDNSEGSLRFLCRDGRACKLCARTDNMPDGVVKIELIFWGHPPKNGKPDGSICYVCLRVYNSRYESRFRQTESLVAHFGLDKNLLMEFKKWREFAVEQMIAKNNRFARFTWPGAVPERLLHEEVDQVNFQEPTEI